MRQRLNATAATLVAIVVTGCASAATNQVPTHDRVLATAGEAVLRSHDGDQRGAVPVALPPDKMLSALKAAYGELGIDVKLWDPPNGQVGNKNFTKMYRLAGASLSTYVGCGLTTNGEAADSYRVTLSIVSQVSPDAGGSKVLTTLSAFAEDLASSKGTIACETRGILEQKILQTAMTHLVS
jgi:hypothetical protein